MANGNGEGGDHQRVEDEVGEEQHFVRTLDPVRGEEVTEDGDEPIDPEDDGEGDPRKGELVLGHVTSTD